MSTNPKEYQREAVRRWRQKRAEEIVEMIDKVKDRPCERCHQPFPPDAMRLKPNEPKTREQGPMESIRAQIESAHVYCAVCASLIGDA